MARASTRKSRDERVGIIGWFMSSIGKHPEASYIDLLVQAIRGAVADAGIGFDMVDGLYVVPDDFGARATPMLATRLPELLGTSTRTLAQVEAGGVTAALAIKTAVQDLRTDQAEVAVVAVGSKTSMAGKSPDPEVWLERALHNQTSLLGPWIFPYAPGAPVPLYAMATQRYMREYGVREEAIARVAVVLRENASRNPLAQFREPITVDDVLASPMISPPIHLLECCTMSEGGGALVLASERAVKRLSKEAVWITGIGEFHTPTHFTPFEGRIDRFPAVNRAAAEAYEKSGIKPGDVDVAEIYGVFAATELITYEELGFFPEGQAAKAVAEGVTKPGGHPAINTSGGRLSLGHPAVATPILETIEVASQLAGRAGERQVASPRVGLIQAEHGMVNGSMVIVLEV